MNLTIKSNQGLYTVNVETSLDCIAEKIILKKNKMAAVIDENILKLHPDFCAKLSKAMPIYSFTAIEQNKNLDGLSSILTFIQKAGLDRTAELIVVGGGITQDVSALAAHLFYRGIPYTLIPTTLLGMADSCIGAKSGLNFNGYKNQLGAFYAPSQIYICTDFLETLSKLEVYSGVGEIMKLFLIDDCLDDLDLTANKQKLLTAIFKALEIKKRFIEQDEFDQGVRKILNYGHTFGHAIEILSDYAIPHGLAVVLGMDIANYIAMRLGVLNKNRFIHIHQTITDFFDWSQFNINLDPQQLVESIKQDKKAERNKISMVLLSDDQKVIVKSLEIDVGLVGLLENYFEEYHINLTTNSIEV